MNGRPTETPVELFVLALVATATLPPEAWADFVVLLAPPTPVGDPAPGIEFAPAEALELPQDVRERVMQRVAEIAAQNLQREAERAKNPPPPDVHRQRVAALAARVQRVAREIRYLGGDLQAEAE